MRARRGLLVCLVLSCACGGSGSPGDDDGGGSEMDAAPPDAAVDASPGVDAGFDAAIEDAGMDAGAGADAATTGMVIESVLIDGSFAQVHQGSVFEIVIAGSGLEGVTDISFEDGVIQDPASLIATATEVRALMFVLHGAAPGPRDVAVTGPEGTAIAPDAFELTPWVFGPDAAAGGRATFESPMALGEFYEEARSGDTLLLLAGEHRSDQGAYLQNGVTVMGQGADTTVVRGDTGVFPGFQFTAGNPNPVFSALRDVTVIAPNGFWSVSWGSDVAGTLTVEDVVLMGDGIEVQSAFDRRLGVVIERVTYDGMGGGGSGLRASGAVGATISDSRFSGCGTAILLQAGELDLTGTTIEGCATGLQIGSGPLGEGGDWHVASSQILDDTTGILLIGGGLLLEDTLIADDEATVAASERGVYVGSGDVLAIDVTIRGQDLAGIEAYRPSCCENTDRLAVDLDGALIEGGQMGVQVHGTVDSGHLTMRSSIVRDQTVAAVSIAMEDGTLFDLSGDNQLSVVSGFALEDLRLDNSLGFIVEAAGITLNGRSYAGQRVQGPASVPPDYRIVDDRGAIQF
jgi:hypothetical protein